MKPALIITTVVALAVAGAILFALDAVCTDGAHDYGDPT